MPLKSENNKKIVKNTLALYFRQIITMIVALFTSRIVLQTLGVTDYGINNVVGGVVAMFGFISGTLMGITQRFISVELGKGGDIYILRKIFSTSMVLHIVAAFVVIILAETVGLWFLNSKLVIPAERMSAANWVYQFTIFGFVLTLLNAPLTALIISHEDMHIYGYMGIFDVIVRLVMVYLLVIINADKLIFYALFGFAVSCLVWFFYFIYCRGKYQEAKFSFVYDKLLAKELGGFGGYTILNNFFVILILQGTNIMLNIFFGPAINTAKGLANSVSSALSSFGSNFRVTLSPQITMTYAANNMDAMWNLVERGTRLFYFLFFIFSIPVLLETEFILKIWLKNVPEYTAIFSKLIIIHALTGLFLSTFVSVVDASGKLKIFYCLSYISFILTLIFSYIICKMGYTPEYVFVVQILIGLIYYPIQFGFAKKIYGFPVMFFIKKALIPIFFVSVISFLPFYFLHKLLSRSVINSLVIIITSILWTGFIIIFIGLTKNERIKIFDFLKREYIFKKKK